jgi:hypothetical protein
MGSFKVVQLLIFRRLWKLSLSSCYGTWCGVLRWRWQIMLRLVWLVFTCPHWALKVVFEALWFLLLFSFLFLPVDLLPLHYCTEFQSLALKLHITAHQKLFLCIWVWFCVFLCMCESFNFRLLDKLINHQTNCLLSSCSCSGTLTIVCVFLLGFWQTNL